MAVSMSNGARELVSTDAYAENVGAFVRISFAGLHYQLNGLSEQQCEQIRGRYGAYQSDALQEGPAERIPVEFRHRAFRDFDSVRYQGLGGAYTPLIDPRPGRVEIEGLHMRAEIHLRPEFCGYLYSNDERMLANPFVFENYLRLITAYACLRAGGLLLHSSTVVVNDQAYIFLGRSNAGKTTISRMALKSGAEVLSDDANVLMPNQDGTGYQVGPIPFAGDLGQTAASPAEPVPVVAIYWLEKADTNEVKELSPSKQFSHLLTCCPGVNVDTYRSAEVFDLVGQVLSTLPLFVLRFSKFTSFTDVLSAFNGVGTDSAKARLE